MKRILINTLMIAASITLVAACSSNTKSENTTIGAVTGAVVGGVGGSFIGAGTGKVVAVGVGAIVGALVGGEIGNHMDSSDASNTFKAMNKNPKNKAMTWKNTKTGTMYTVIPTSKVMTVGNNTHCRTFRATSLQSGESQKEITGTACRLTNGNWKTVNA
jgi:surface antigen